MLAQCTGGAPLRPGRDYFWACGRAGPVSDQHPASRARQPTLPRRGRGGSVSDVGQGKAGRAAGTWGDPLPMRNPRYRAGMLFVRLGSAGLLCPLTAALLVLVSKTVCHSVRHGGTAVAVATNVRRRPRPWLIGIGVEGWASAATSGFKLRIHTTSLPSPFPPTLHTTSPTGSPTVFDRNLMRAQRRWAARRHAPGRPVPRPNMAALRLDMVAQRAWRWNATKEKGG